jgi:hypothetical protein
LLAEVPPSQSTEDGYQNSNEKEFSQDGSRRSGKERLAEMEKYFPSKV